MADFPQDAFTLWFNCNKDQKTEGAYWASSEVPVDELRKLFAWIKEAPKTENDKGQECVQLRAGLRPRTSKAGNDYLLLAISDQKPRKPEANNNIDF
jgi:hypothetical protein